MDPLQGIAGFLAWGYGTKNQIMYSREAIIGYYMLNIVFKKSFG
jgi:hypothetical protein